MDRRNMQQPGGTPLGNKEQQEKAGSVRQLFLEMADREHGLGGLARDLTWISEAGSVMLDLAIKHEQHFNDGGVFEISPAGDVTLLETAGLPRDRVEDAGFISTALGLRFPGFRLEFSTKIFETAEAL